MDQVTVISAAAGESPPQSQLPPINRHFKPKGPPAPTGGMKDFPLYTAGQKGALYVPSEMTEADFALLKQQLDAYLMVIKATSVRNN